MDSLTEGNLIFVFNNKIYTDKDSTKIQSVIGNLLSPKGERSFKKKYKMAILRGKKAYEKYGIIGLYGVIEYNHRKRRKEK